MTVLDRIEYTRGYPAISLTPSEQELYEHAGYRLANFSDGKLVEFFDPMEFDSPVHALQGAIEWMERHDGETCLVLCSGFALCEPQLLKPNEPATLKHLAEVVHQGFSDYYH